MNYLIIGSGRTARNWQYYLELLKIPVKNWNRKLPESLLNPLIQEASHVLLLISDASIDGFYQRYSLLKTKTCLHFSGALEIPEIHGVHPLASFTHQLLKFETLKNIPLITSSRLSADQLMPGISNSIYHIDPKDKPKYHALCVMAGNFSVLLWQKISSEFLTLGLPEHIEKTYREIIFENINSQLSTALTGPIARKDDATIFKNLQALHGDAYQKIYLAFLNAYYPRAAEAFTNSHSGGVP